MGIYPWEILDCSPARGDAGCPAVPDSGQLGRQNGKDARGHIARARRLQAVQRPRATRSRKRIRRGCGPRHAGRMVGQRSTEEAGRKGIEERAAARGRRPFLREVLRQSQTSGRSRSGCRRSCSSCRSRLRRDGGAGFQSRPQSPWWQSRWTGCPPWLRVPCSGRR